MDDNSAAITINASAIASIEGWGAAQYSVTLDVNNYATGFELINGGPGVSSTIFTTDKFLIAAPGVSGGAPVPIFTVANVNGSPKVAIRGDMYVDGTIAGSAIITGSLTATQIAANSITADRLVTGTITSDSGKIGALSVKSLSIGDSAVTVPVAETRNDLIQGTAINVTCSAINLSIDTTGLSGKPITVIAGFTGNLAYGGSGSTPTCTLFINGAQIIATNTVNSSDYFMAQSGSYTFTGTGGVVNIPVIINFTSLSGVLTALSSRTLWAMAGKR